VQKTYSVEKAVSAIPAGLKCETRYNCCCLSQDEKKGDKFSFSTMPITVSDRPFVMSVMSVGGGAGGWVQISTLIHFNTPFRSCFTKEGITPHTDR